MLNGITDAFRVVPKGVATFSGTSGGWASGPGAAAVDAIVVRCGGGGGGGVMETPRQPAQTSVAGAGAGADARGAEVIPRHPAHASLLGSCSIILGSRWCC